MGVLKDMIKQLGRNVIEEDSEEIEKSKKAGEAAADKIAKKMGQDRTSFVPKVDVSTPPVEMYVEEAEREESEKGGR